MGTDWSVWDIAPEPGLAYCAPSPQHRPRHARPRVPLRWSSRVLRATARITAALLYLPYNAYISLEAFACKTPT